MTKGQGFTAIGTLLLTGVVFHSSLNSTKSPNSDVSDKAVASAEKPTDDEGPWVASCRYWAAVRTASSTGTKSTPQLTIKLNETKSAFNAAISGSVDNKKTDCASGADAWGIPATKPKAEPKRHSKPGLAVAPKPDAVPDIHAIIVAVPDPVHSHLALEFDRSIDALLQAAADYNYLGSTYWLPWHSPSNPVPAQPTEADQTAERKRQEQPGLLVLKYSPSIPEGETKSRMVTASYYQVVYLFLVGESPALGMNGTQLQNALAYEEYLRKNRDATLSMEFPEPGTDSDLAFIGPRSSGSAISLRQALLSAPFAKLPSRIIGAGITSTDVSQLELNAPSSPQISYTSFGEDTKYEEDQFLQALRDSGTDNEPTAILVEDNTLFGSVNAAESKEAGEQKAPSTKPPDPTNPTTPSPLYIRFPREISLLRNAQGAQSPSSFSSLAPGPYLNLSLKDPGNDDTVPKFSTTQTPLSQEAQLMAIERQLQKEHIRHILITASNVLDEIFLARELHRACPNASIVFYNGGDLLIERDVDNLPYIGSITISPHSLITFDHPSVYSRRFFSDSQAASVYNAASYIFWWGSNEWKKNHLPRLADAYTSAANSLQFPLLVTAVGNDGYYPLGILSPCASHSSAILPQISLPDTKNFHSAPCVSPAANTELPPDPYLPSQEPSLFWYLLCSFIVTLSLIHAIALYSASYWSPFTRDLAIQQNDEPRRRAVYVHIGTSMLVCMSLAVTIPWLTFGQGPRHYPPAFWTACVTLASAAVTIAVTIYKTASYHSVPKHAKAGDQIHLYPWFNFMSAATVVLVLVFMLHLCWQPASWGTSYVGLFFSYRCLYPISGVSPLIPLLLLFFAWYLWATFQTARLRFSAMNRPRLPRPVGVGLDRRLFVSDQALEACDPPLSCCLFQNIDCLLITRELVVRFTRWRPGTVNWLLTVIYSIAFFICAVVLHIESLDRFLLHPGHLLTAYEWLIAIFFYPLIMIALAGWLRTLLIWASLKGGLLDPLERSPLRLAFSRLCEVNWVTMLGQSGLNVRWRDMALSSESLLQLMNCAEIKEAAGNGYASLKQAYDKQTGRTEMLLKCIEGDATISEPPECIAVDPDLPHDRSRRELCFIHAIEQGYATFTEELLEHILIPYWTANRIGFVHAEPESSGPRHIADAPEDPLHIRLAEEFVAIRYVALIRAVLVNIRYLMLFVSSAFVLAIVSWNSYPFQPHQILDWIFTLLLLCLSIGFIWVFAQMHRNTILSRITATTPNELGMDFYIRLITFGGIPVLTWLAYQFPEIGGNLFRILQPSLQVAK
jgi:hypothetical protein